MRKRIRALSFVAIFVATLLLMPTTYAKYSTDKTFYVNVSANTYFKNTSSGSAVKVDLPYVGRYLIIAKGGDGADGRKNNGDDYKEPSVNGGIGGTVMGIYTTTNTTTSLYLCPGTAGEVAAEAAWSPGKGGKNTGANGYSGGKGSYVKDTGPFSSSTSGCGGGAASVVFLGSNNSGTKLLIAGGGGAGGCYNVMWRSIGVVDAKPGGNGGNMDSTQHKVTGGVEYDGFDGQGDDFSSWGINYSTSGKAGKTSGGVGGSINRQATIIDPGNGKPGSSNGDGGEAYQYGGGGGAGYCGGGGGASSSINYAAGGGGGGSSFVSSTLTALSDADMDLADTMISIAKTSTSSRSAIPTQYTDCSGSGDGYVIVMYLGA
ncbi:MAG: hypothetical protein KBS82_07805 [Oscillospiraceae bacterium]|nr:hypothetical protein [Candidatus Limimonas egerieequi]